MQELRLQNTTGREVKPATLMTLPGPGSQKRSPTNQTKTNQQRLATSPKKNLAPIASHQEIFQPQVTTGAHHKMF